MKSLVSELGLKINELRENKNDWLGTKIGVKRRGDITAYLGSIPSG